jgi:hypothetical protein
VSLATLSVLACAGVLYGVYRAGELRIAQAACVGLGGYMVATSRIGPHLAHAMVTVYWWVGTWPP